MTKLLTTITPYWGRPEQLQYWIRAITGATCAEIEHILFVVEDGPLPVCVLDVPANVRVIKHRPGGNLSIGHFHNIGAEMANSEWIMKLDVDALPHSRYFHTLLGLLRPALPKAWFNGGMFYVNKVFTDTVLSGADFALSHGKYLHVMHHRQSASASSYLMPQASNFICRRDDYLRLGGCDARFRGWGWEDYQQIYMLERYEKGQDPLPGPITIQNVSQRCRDEISRPSARSLFQWSPDLCLLHRWHKGSNDPSYKASQHGNRHVLFNYINKARQ